MTAGTAAEMKVYVIEKRDLQRFFWLECVIGPMLYFMLKHNGAHEAAAFAGSMTGTTALKYTMKRAGRRKSTQV